MNIKLISDLQLFTIYYSREQYKLCNGEEAPPFDKSLPIKLWEDPARVKDGNGQTYFRAPRGGETEMLPFDVKPSQARVNLPESDVSLYPTTSTGPNTPIPVRQLQKDEHIIVLTKDVLVLTPSELTEAEVTDWFGGIVRQVNELRARLEAVENHVLGKTDQAKDPKV